MQGRGEHLETTAVACRLASRRWSVCGPPGSWHHALGGAPLRLAGLHIRGASTVSQTQDGGLVQLKLLLESAFRALDLHQLFDLQGQTSIIMTMLILCFTVRALAKSFKSCHARSKAFTVVFGRGQAHTIVN